MSVSQFFENDYCAFHLSLIYENTGFNNYLLIIVYICWHLVHICNAGIFIEIISCSRLIFTIRCSCRYPWSEDPTESGSFMKTRAPAWCDRVLMNSDAFQLVNSDNDAKYDSIGKIVCMGDHKVIIYFLAIDVIYWKFHNHSEW